MTGAAHRSEAGNGYGRRRPGGWWSWVRRVGLLIVGVVALEYVAVHLLAGASASWSSAGTAAPVLLSLALALELGSFCSFSALTLSLLTGVARPAYRTVLAIDLTGNGVSHVVPGGGATAAALRFRLLGRARVPLAEAVGTATLQSAVTTLWLVAAFLLGLVVAVPNPRTHPFLRTAAVLAVVLLAVFGGLVAVLVARPDQLVRVTHEIGRRLRLVHPETVERIVRTLTDQVRLVIGSRARSRHAVLFGLATWSLDATCLYLSVRAFGFAPNPGGLLTTYALVSLLALLPLTPGGLGLVEGVAVPVLVSFGTPHDAALLGVLTWRLLEFWLPIPLALGAYLWLRVAAPDRPSG